MSEQGVCVMQCVVGCVLGVFGGISVLGEVILESFCVIWDVWSSKWYFGVFMGYLGYISEFIKSIWRGLVCLVGICGILWVFGNMLLVISCIL